MFINVTRVYRTKEAVAAAKKAKATKVPVKTQPIVVASAAIEVDRPSNRLGHPEHRSTLVLKSGGEIDVAETFSQVKKALGIRS
jgi:hypothetical protein